MALRVDAWVRVNPNRRGLLRRNKSEDEVRGTLKRTDGDRGVRGENRGIRAGKGRRSVSRDRSIN